MCTRDYRRICLEKGADVRKTRSYTPVDLNRNIEIERTENSVHERRKIHSGCDNFYAEILDRLTRNDFSYKEQNRINLHVLIVYRNKRSFLQKWVYSRINFFRTVYSLHVDIAVTRNFLLISINSYLRFYARREPE